MATGSAPKPPSLLVMLLVGVGSVGFFAVLVLGIQAGDPDTRAAVVLGLLSLVAVVVVVLAVRRARARGQRRRRVLAEGTRARARIVSVRTEGANEFRTRVGFELEVALDGEEPYLVYCAESIPNLNIPRVQPQTLIDVWVDPEDPQQVVIDPELADR